MKKLGIMFVMAGALAFGLSSCGDDTVTDATPRPSFDWKGGAEYVSQNSTVQAGDQIKFGINATGVENLEKVRVTLSYNGGTETIVPLTADGDSIITSLKTKNFSMDIPYSVGSIKGTEKVTVIVYMSNGTTASKSILLTVNAASVAVQSRTNAEVGAQSNATYGSFWSFNTFQALLTADANSNPGTIDMIYYYGATNKATLAAPDDAQVAQVHASVANWGTRNATQFRKTTLTSADFDNITMSDAIDTEVAAGSTLKMANDLQVGDVVLFLTAGNKTYGLLRINSITPASSSGVLSFDAKFVSN
ncbi:MAG: hypothetical protein EP332_04510 [Bacteroidetes bacterium]|nr:MAG: hypothetical protein EP332_04510 [Bacteroidota bacterium]